MTAPPAYDAFLSYNSLDHAIVERVAKELGTCQCKCFVDRWYLQPGRNWVEALDPSIRKIAAGDVQRLPECNAGITESSVAMATLSTFEPTPVIKIKPPSDMEQTRKIRIVQCQNCGMLVVPKGNGKCPSCQTEISIES